MKTTPGLRWACYAIAAAATGAAMWHVDHPGDAAGAVQPARPAPRGLAMPVSAPRPAASPDALALLKQRLDAALSGSADPFSEGGSVAKAAAAPAVPQAAVAPAEPVAPAMPFTYVGRWQEQGQTVVFLQAGDRVLSVKGPGPLEGSSYAVETIAADSLTLRMPGGPSQVLSFAAPAAAAATAARVQATAESAAPAMEEN